MGANRAASFFFQPRLMTAHTNLARSSASNFMENAIFCDGVVLLSGAPALESFGLRNPKTTLANFQPTPATGPRSLLNQG
jgi:hypothetical protein